MPSTVINHYEYDDKEQTLTLTFITGMVYRYREVPEKVYKLFRASISKGKYFNYHIKDKFKFEKID